MYLNVISFKNGKTLSFQSKVPFSADKLSEEFNVVTDAVNNQILTFRSPEVVTIANLMVPQDKKRKLATKITEE